jgi:hypothetical protein
MKQASAVAAWTLSCLSRSVGRGSYASHGKQTMEHDKRYGQGITVCGRLVWIFMHVCMLPLRRRS